MNRYDALFGHYLVGNSPVHRWGVGWKYLVVLICTVPALIVGWWPLSLLSMTAMIGLLLATRLPVRFSLRLGPGVIALVVVLSAYQFWLGRPVLALVVSANVVTAVYGGRLLTLTTPGPVLIDALVVASRPLERIVPRFSAERFGLAVSLMVRSIPYLGGSFADVRRAAAARGLQRNLFANLTPVVVGAVSYARRTGDALAARGLGLAHSRADEGALRHRDDVTHSVPGRSHC